MQKLFHSLSLHKTKSNCKSPSEEESTECDRSPDCPAEYSFGQTDVILRRFFDFVSYEDLKACRLVCSKWKRISKKSFTRKSRITANFTSSTNLKQFKIDLQMILDKFDDIAAFGFRGIFPHSVITDLLNTSLQNVIINELYIDSIKVLDDFGNIIKTFDLSVLIQPTLSKLYVNSQCFNVSNTAIPQTRVIVPLDSLFAIETLYLKQCTVCLDLVGKIAPKELTLKLNTFMRNDVKLDQVTINDFLNFSQLKKMTLWGSFIDSVWEYSDDRNTIVVDLSEPVSIQTMELYRAKISNWTTAKWKMDTAFLSKVPFTKQQNLTIRHLEVDSEVVLPFIPKSVERLVLKQKLLSDVVFSGNLQHNFSSNLKYLHLHNVNLLERFAECGTLTHLELTAMWTESVDMKIIPKSVRKLKLAAVKITNVGLIPALSLDSLILQDYDDKWESVENVLTLVRPSHLFMFNEHTERYLHANGIGKLVDMQFESFALGRFVFNCNTLFENYSFKDFVDERAEYYLFADGKTGKSIEEKKFKKLTQF